MESEDKPVEIETAAPKTYSEKQKHQRMIQAFKMMTNKEINYCPQHIKKISGITRGEGVSLGLFPTNAQIEHMQKIMAQKRAAFALNKRLARKGISYA